MKIHCDWALLAHGPEADVELTMAGGRFTDVAVGVDPSPESERRRGFTIPGLANSHSHAFHRALRGHSQGDRGSFWTWRETMYRVAERLDPERYLRLARAVFAEMACAGITTVGEFHYVHHGPDGTPYNDANAMGAALIEAAAQAGVRLTLLDTLYQHGGLDADGYRPPTGVQRRYCDASIDAWLSRIDDRQSADHVHLGVAVHSARAVDTPGMHAAQDWATRHQAPIHAHVSEQPAENDACLGYHGATPTELLAAAGVLGPRFSAVHATHLTASDIDGLGSTGSTVCFCPSTERDLGDGIGPSSELVTAGAVLSLGSDSHAVIDVLEEARLVELHERLRSGQRGLHATADLMAMATVNGHQSLGWDDVGLIRPGARADLVTVNLSSTRTAGAVVDHESSALLAAAVFAAGAADVTDVMVDGVTVVTDSHHRSVDVAAELQSTIAEVLAGD